MKDEDVVLLSGSSGDEADLESEAADEELVILGLEGYMFEPLKSKESELGSEIESEDEDEGPAMSGGRTGNFTWCGCGKCRAMSSDSEIESICCMEFSNITTGRFEVEGNYQ